MHCFGPGEPGAQAGPDAIAIQELFQESDGKLRVKRARILGLLEGLGLSLTLGRNNGNKKAIHEIRVTTACTGGSHEARDKFNELWELVVRKGVSEKRSGGSQPIHLKGAQQACLARKRQRTAERQSGAHKANLMKKSAAASKLEETVVQLEGRIVETNNTLRGLKSRVTVLKKQLTLLNDAQLAAEAEGTEGEPEDEPLTEEELLREDPECLVQRDRSLSRSNLSFELFEVHFGIKQSRHCIGFDSLRQALMLFRAWRGVFRWGPEIRDNGDGLGMQRNRFRNGSYKTALSEEEKVFVTLLAARRGFAVWTIASVFGVDRKYVSAALAEYMPRLGQVWRALSNFSLWPDFREIADKLMPQEYIDLGYADMQALVDGSDITCESDRKSWDVKKEMFSAKMHYSALRGLTFTLPCGLSCCESDLFLARVSETELYKRLGLAGFLDYMHASDVVGADKGFITCRSYNPRLQRILCPAHLGRTGRTQFSYDECEESVPLCRLRYTAETFYDRVKNWEYLNDDMKYEKLKYANHVWLWAHAMANVLYKPLRLPAMGVQDELPEDDQD